jgi:hypothetical protein
MFMTSKKLSIPSIQCAVWSMRLLRGKEEDFYGAGPSPGCSMKCLIIQHVFRKVKTGKQALANREVSQVGIADQ